MRLVEETRSDDGRQDGTRWMLAQNLSRAGANTAWAVAMIEVQMSARAALMRLGAAHDRLASALKIAFSPQIYVRGQNDTSALVARFYGVQSESSLEVMTPRAKSDLDVLLSDPLTLDASVARSMLVRLPAGVLAWK